MGGRCASAEVAGGATWGVATIKDREVGGARFLWEVLQGRVEDITKAQGNNRENVRFGARACHMTCYKYSESGIQDNGIQVGFHY
jgi:hypothetical protein